MTLGELLELIKKEKPTGLSHEFVTRKVNEVEAIVQDYLEIPIGRRVSYVWPDDKERKLIVDAPYSRMYAAYLKASIDFANEELESYTNNMAQFESDYDEWVDFVIRHGRAPRTAPVKIKGWW